MINPDDFIITRKRKKYKFALFSNSPLCFELDEWQARQIDCIEIGAGTGGFSVALAERHPDKTFLAIDVKGDRLQKGARLAEEKRLTNIWFLRARADQLNDVARPASVRSIWVTFSDPFPRKRSAGRRLTHPTYLALYNNLLVPKGSLYIKHDSVDFFHWSLEQLVAQDWCIAELSFDLHDADVSSDYKVVTDYEQRWMNDGLTTNFVHATKSDTVKK